MLKLTQDAMNMLVLIEGQVRRNPAPMFKAA